MGNAQIWFDADGVCNYCYEYNRLVIPKRFAPAEKKHRMEEAIRAVSEMGLGRKYDCILGLSGGMDSSFIAYLAMVHKLRPLVVHLDNGWDAELAVQNIENIIRRTGFDYYNYVIDWEEFKDLQLAYLRASVIDVEVVTDQAIFAVLHIVAKQLGVRHILIGDNPATERVMPRGWNYRKNDRSNLLAIHRRFGTRKLRTYPIMGVYDQRYYNRICGIQYVPLLHYVDYDYRRVEKLLQHEFGWRNYAWKHCESVFTRFYQGYILPRKFQVDKRKAHLSDLVLSGQMSRDEALAKLRVPYYTEAEFQTDYDFVVRKFALTREQFEELLSRPPVPHEAFPMDRIGRFEEIKLKYWDLWARLTYRMRCLMASVLGTEQWGRYKRKWVAKQNARHAALGR